jgi:hypothetical protein
MPPRHAQVLVTTHDGAFKLCLSTVKKLLYLYEFIQNTPAATFKVTSA